ncbi:MAG TPA: TIGR02147 family protein [Bdellovibrionales bacterium]|nr:TIGR02147 family protein [Bdellovibrionales bacterium]
MEVVQPRLLLQREFAQRCERNPRYSLRAFARSLGLSHSTLSMVLTGKRRLSRKMFSQVAPSLHLTETEKSAVSRYFGPDELGFLEVPEDTQFRQISLDTFAVISDWYHYAIICLLDLRESQFTAPWIAERLGLTVVQAQEAMDRLVRLGMVVRVGRRWKYSGLPLKVDNLVTESTEATRKFHTQHLFKAIESLNHDPANRRAFNGMTFTMDPSLIPLAVQRIRDFQRRLVRELEKKGSGKAVYSINIQVFPLEKVSRSWV